MSRTLLQLTICSVFAAATSLGLCSCSPSPSTVNDSPQLASSKNQEPPQSDSALEDAPDAPEPEVEIIEVVPEDAIVLSDYDDATAKAIQAVVDGAELVGEEYAISIPDEMKDQLYITYESGYEDAGGGSGEIYSGFHSKIWRLGAEWSLNEEVCYIAILSDTWGPQTDMDTMNLGHPSNMPDATVWIMQVSDMEPSMEKIASWITVF